MDEGTRVITKALKSTKFNEQRGVVVPGAPKGRLGVRFDDKSLGYVKTSNRFSKDCWVSSVRRIAPTQPPRENENPFSSPTVHRNEGSVCNRCVGGCCRTKAVKLDNLEVVSDEEKIETGDEACGGSADCAILKRTIASEFSEADLAHLETM